MKLLDLFCGAGGAAMGYYRAGFTEIIGVDIEPQPHYPFTFIRADALSYFITESKTLLQADLIHASPPCQAYSGPKSVNGDRGHPKLIEATRDFLLEKGIPYVLENVVQAPVRRDLLLCGEMFQLPVIRHRIFELGGLTINQPPHPVHRGRVRGWRHGVYYDGPYLAVYGKGGGKASLVEARDALGVQWMQTRDEVIESIPPCYTEFIGRAILSSWTPALGVSTSPTSGTPTIP